MNIKDNISENRYATNIPANVTKPKRANLGPGILEQKYFEGIHF